MNKQEFKDELPILSLRNNVLFPGVVIPITVGRDKSIKLIQDANKGDKKLPLPIYSISLGQAENVQNTITTPLLEL
ncbi:LON peptidase substrate-binding domain-containing protein [Crocinitomicaceae bacterium]|nr:LON peptidase substrate-binding domain-containing protein [Crocinitomicaceae bacterium]